MTDFEVAVAREARRRGHDGVVCGHIHRAEMRTIDGTLYCNDGDWVESRTALVEHEDGRLEVLQWKPVDHDGDLTLPSPIDPQLALARSGAIGRSEVAA